MSRGPLKTSISEGQRYVDEPIERLVSKPKAERCTPIAESVGAVFGSRPPSEIKETLGHERVQLRWMKPDGKGGLLPRDEG